MLYNVWAENEINELRRRVGGMLSELMKAQWERDASITALKLTQVSYTNERGEPVPITTEDETSMKGVTWMNT
jgi:hypothetical protein